MGNPDARWVRTLTLATSIPMVLLAGPLVGYLLGTWIERRWLQLAPWGSGIGLVVGVIAGARQAWMLIRQLQANQ